ncbi:MAG: choice-of-anchor D domain-containing protein [Candidatus Sulfotelmatobacter sp.]
MKNALRLSFLLLVLCGVLAAQTKVPTCNNFDATGAPVYIDPNSGTTITPCTDFFGVGNWANSPLPAGTITGFTLINGGDGYVNPVVVITDPTGGTGASATATADSTGALTAITGGGGSGYIMPQVTIVDVGQGGTLGAATCGGTAPIACGSGAMATAIIGGTFTGGMRKFVDALPDLKGAIATPDTTTFPGSDFYVIGLTEYKTVMHTDLPPTTLRGYVQLNNGTDAHGSNTVAPKPQSYLGPVIVAAKDRPVRVLFRNLLPTGAGGNLFIPVDTTYMGSGPNDPQNRATLHLHGGATPWISDGTPHQWTTPEGDTPMNGVSTQPVPDMYFAGGTIVPFCTATGTANCFTPGNPSTLPLGATTKPPAGDMTFYWTNQQGGRLMFYHDHAYGITRLNVYAGEAAGYLLYDPAEEAGLATATAPGSIATGDLTHLIPLVIQDKTFVPSPAQIAAQDPTWVAFGTTPGAANAGDLWFSHVYMPNQDPADALGGGNPYGRWDYGPWFFPPMTTLTAATPPSAVTIPCTSAAFPGQVLAPSPANNNQVGCPIIPNASGTPESFMDTPIVNGKAYPVLHVAPAAYRFQILSAGNDRSWNLSWFKADPNSPTEVAMLPAAPPTAGAALPLCTTINPVAVPGLVIGLATGKLDGTGNPLNGTGLPSGCWPNYGPQPGIPTPQTMWAADGRSGGAPDPRNAGPAWIQIGSEGGLLPAPVVIPPTAINYEQNMRSITVTSVAVHGLWLGPAERADVIVDFSKFAGQTLILYNDAPTPAPANDSRLDYFTGDGDQTPIGGAPNTPPGYGPNTRTVMQVVVDGTAPNQVPFSLPTLKAAFASTANTKGLFASTQPTTIVPEPNYNSAYAGNFPPTYASISADTLTFNPLAPLTFEALLSQEPSACVGTTTAPTQCASLNHKAIQELFTLDYGRMNATLGTELPNVNFTNQTTIPLGYVDPATEIIRQGDTQLWKITHNGVDSHFIHFHLFNVQVINRVGWDGSLRPPDANEMGWKDTVRMNPLEDIIVGLQPITPLLPWPLPNSVRLNDVSGSNMNFSNLNPFSNGGANTADGPTNFGWEYVWHCHILGHEENDMMRPIMWQVPPNTPGPLVVAANLNGGVDISFTDNSASETGFTVQRDIDPAFPNPTTIQAAASLTRNVIGEGTDYGTMISVNDPSALTLGTTYYYRVQAIDDGFNSPYEQVYNNTSALLSGWSNTAMISPVPIIGVAPVSLAFGTVAAGSSSISAPVVISNTGTATLTITGMNSSAGDFVPTTCSSVPAGQTCSFTVTFSPTAGGAQNATLTIASNDPARASVMISMTGTGIVGTATAITAPAITYGVNGVITVAVAQTTGTLAPTGSVTLTVDGGAPLTQPLSAGSATFTMTTPAVGNHTLVANYAAQNGFQASTNSGTLVVNGATLTITASSGTMTYGGPVPAITPSFSAFVLGQTNLTAFTTQPTCSTTATNASPVTSYPSTCSGAVAPNYSITYAPGTVIVSKASSTTVIASNLPNPSIIGQIVTIRYTVTPQFAGSTVTGTVTVQASTGERCSAAPTAGACTITFQTGGTRTLTATYSGDGNVSGSASAAPTQNVSSVSLSTTSLLFGNQVVGTRSASQTVTIANVGTTTLTITGIAWSPNFSDSNNCGGSLAPGRTCRVNVAFVPTTTGVLTGTLTITDSDVTSPQIVTLTGTGVQAAVSLSPTSHNFGTQARRTTSAPFTFILSNPGTESLTINSINLGGANANQFAIQSRTCTNTLAAGSSCNINVVFSPANRATYNATLQVNDNAPGSPQTASLTGTGQ